MKNQIYNIFKVHLEGTRVRRSKGFTNDKTNAVDTEYDGKDNTHVVDLRGVITARARSLRARYPRTYLRICAQTKHVEN